MKHLSLKFLIAIIFIIAITASAQKQSAPFIKPAPPSPTAPQAAPAAPAPIYLMPNQLAAIQERYNAVVEVQSALALIKQLLADKSGGCTAQVIDRLEAEYSLRNERLHSAMVELRYDLAVPKGWGFDIQRGKFSPPVADK